MVTDRQRLEEDPFFHLKKELVEGFEGIRGQLQRLQGTIDGIEVYWQGIGAGAFDGKQTEINQRIVKIGNILAQFIEAMDTNSKINTQTDDAVRAQVQSIDVNLGAKSALSGF
ncbi:WXG100 family type VII secretion target [Streptomyces sp. NPDC018693]|uniref:WXG100 family type VII secretion target n=1 Tax=unclassified Streptomyces TaxID=2593676 RepID=UPI0037B03ACC